MLHHNAYLFIKENQIASLTNQIIVLPGKRVTVKFMFSFFCEMIH